MIDINELRPAVEVAGLNAISMQEVLELLDRLEEAESDALEQARLNGMGASREAALLAKLEAAEKERDKLKELNSALYTNSNSQVIHNARLAEENYALRSKIEAMERQEPVAQVGVHKTGGNPGIAWSARPLNEFDSLPLLCDGDKLYALPGAQPAQKAVAYLDLGVGGYMDVGTDLTDEALAALPKGRHMLGIVGTYGVEGYSPAQPAPSVPVDLITDYLVSISAHVAHQEEPQAQAEIRELLRMLAAAPEAKP